MSRPTAWCALRKFSSNGPPTSPRPTTSVGASGLGMLRCLLVLLPFHLRSREADKRFDGLHKRLLLRGPAELVQSDPAPGRSFPGRLGIGQQGADRTGKILRVVRFEEQQFVIGKVVPHRGDA